MLLPLFAAASGLNPASASLSTSVDFDGVLPRNFAKSSALPGVSLSALISCSHFVASVASLSFDGESKVSCMPPGSVHVASSGPSSTMAPPSRHLFQGSFVLLNQGREDLALFRPQPGRGELLPAVEPDIGKADPQGLVAKEWNRAADVVGVDVGQDEQLEITRGSACCATRRCSAL